MDVVVGEGKSKEAAHTQTHMSLYQVVTVSRFLITTKYSKPAPAPILSRPRVGEPILREKLAVWGLGDVEMGYLLFCCCCCVGRSLLLWVQLSECVLPLSPGVMGWYCDVVNRELHLVWVDSTQNTERRL